jgi:hypothetical protein
MIQERNPGMVLSSGQCPVINSPREAYTDKTRRRSWDRDFIRNVYHGTASLAGWERIALVRLKFLDALREELNLKAEGLH